MTSTARSNSSNSNSRPPARTLAPNKTLELGGGLSLTPRLKLLLTFFRSDHSVRPVDEWRLKSALLDFLRDGPLALSVPDEDLVLRRRSDLSKRKRDEPVASGVLFVRDFGFRGKSRDGDHGEESERKRYVEWRERVVGRLDGMEVNVEGVGFRLSVELPQADDYERLKESWEEFYASRSLGNNRFSRGATVRPDTIVVKGLPSRWFAEPRVSSKPSMLVTHTIFSALGKIRNINVASDDAFVKTIEEGKGDIICGLHCKVWVQFENYEDFHYALSALCGRSLQKEGSRLKADYEVACDTDGFFSKSTQKVEGSHAQDRYNHSQAYSRHFKTEDSRVQSRIKRETEDSHPRRFRVVAEDEGTNPWVTSINNRNTKGNSESQVEILTTESYS